MRIALTGASSTGKTTLLNDLLATMTFKNAVIERKQLNVRAILDDMGLCADAGSAEQVKLRSFQWTLLEKKIQQENEVKSYITDRSTVDMASYWIIRDTKGDIDTEGEKYLSECRSYAETFDVHIHLPFGKIPFIEDGKRPTDIAYNEKSCETIVSLLREWELLYFSLEKTDPTERVQEVIQFLNQRKIATVKILDI